MAEKFSDVMFSYGRALDNFEGTLIEAGFGDYESLDGDYYDNSIEFRGVIPGARLTPEVQRLLFDAGFAQTWLNHTDGSQTHYGWDWRKEFKASPGSHRPAVR